jgi:hemoglobin
MNCSCRGAGAQGETGEDQGVSHGVGVALDAIHQLFRKSFVFGQLISSCDDWAQAYRNGRAYTPKRYGCYRGSVICDNWEDTMAIRMAHRLRRSSIIISLAAICLWMETSVPSALAAEKSLYERLGGKAAITAVVEDFSARQLSDARLNKYYKLTNKAAWKGHLIDLICKSTGGPCSYVGRPMNKAHARQYITEDQFGWTASHLVTSLNKFKVPKREQDELVAIIVSLKDNIVGW